MVACLLHVAPACVRLALGFLPQPNIPLHCTALHCTALHCTALHCTVQHVAAMLRAQHIPFDMQIADACPETCTHVCLQNVVKVSMPPGLGTDTPFSQQEPDKDVWDAGPDQFAQEPIFCPRPDAQAEDDGWVLVMVYNSVTDRSHLVILDAQDLKKGPVARVKLPQMIPYGKSLQSSTYVLRLCCAAPCCRRHLLRCAALRCAALRCAALRCAALCCAVLCCAVLCCAVLCCAVLCCAVLCCADMT